MDPISLIIAAVLAGASDGLKDAAGEAAGDAYRGLKELLRRKLAGNRAAEITLDEIDRDPEAWQKPLESQLRESSVGEDQDVICAAQQLLERIDPDGARAGKYSVTISGGKGIVVGDRATVTQHFSDDG
jgi:hypothetical protein